MKIALFKDETKANDFTKEVRVLSLEYHDGDIVVIYEPYLSIEEEKIAKIKEDEREARKGLIQAEMHMVYLNEVEKTVDDKEIESGKKTAKESILNHKAKLAAVEQWKKM